MKVGRFIALLWTLPYTQPDLSASMKQRFLPLATFLLLMGCTAATHSLTVDLAFRTEDTSRRAQVITALEHVMERRVYAIEGTIASTSTRGEGATAQMTVTFENEETTAVLAGQLTEPLNFQLMAEAAEEEADVTTEQFGSFALTGITEEMLEWVTAHEVEGTGTITITFTEEGVPLLRDLFAANAGKRLGLFVHGGLVSTYVIQEGEVDKSNIVISGIPSVELARIFADDVNVGTYVTFTPHL